MPQLYYTHNKLTLFVFVIRIKYIRSRICEYNYILHVLVNTKIKVPFVLFEPDQLVGCGLNVNIKLNGKVCRFKLSSRLNFHMMSPTIRMLSRIRFGYKKYLIHNYYSYLKLHFFSTNVLNRVYNRVIPIINPKLNFTDTVVP